MPAKPPPGSVLLLVDMQRSIDLMQAQKSAENPAWGGRNNPSAEAQAARLLEHWRAQGWPVWHVRHDSKEPASHYRPGQPGNDFKPEVAPRADELVIPKQTNSAFIGTDLEDRLRSGGHGSLVVVGVSSSNSVEATVRMAGNLGFDTYLVADASFTFGCRDWNGVPRTADEVHAMSLANMDGEYCSVITTAELLGEAG
jgi:nicotinamidase-related amidase